MTIETVIKKLQTMNDKTRQVMLFGTSDDGRPVEIHIGLVMVGDRDEVILYRETELPLKMKRIL